MKSIKEIYLKWKPKIIIGFSVVLIAVAALNIYYVIDVRITSNDECLWIHKKISTDSMAIFFYIVKVEGVTWNAGIRNGDQLLKINGVLLSSTFEAQIILNQVKSGKYADYVVEKVSGEVISTKVYIKKLIQFGNLANSLSALFWMIIGFIVLTAKPEGRTHKLFYALGVFAVFTTINVLLPVDYEIYTYVKEEPLIVIIITIIWSIGIGFVGPTILYFFWNFPQPFN